jgi:hypothetical protein
MATLGEAALTLDGTRVGKIRARNIYADSAIFPRLGITIEFNLGEPKDIPRPGGRPALAGYELHDISGQLRMEQHGSVVGRIGWAEERRSIRSSPVGTEASARFACDLDHWRLEQVEKRRQGAGPRFWLELWPIIWLDSRALDASIPSFEMRVPIEDWLQFVSQVGGIHWDLVEIPFPPTAEGRFRRGVEVLAAARAKMAEGDNDGAIAECRKAIEALAPRGRPRGKAAAAPPTPFEGLVDPKQGEHYVGVISRIKQLSALAHHETGQHRRYSRVEAQFVVRITEALIALIAGLAAQAPHGPTVARGES